MFLDSIAGRLMVFYSTRTAALVTAAIVAIVAIGEVAAPVSAQDSAQNDTADQLLACDGMSDPAERLACINDLVEGLKQSPVAPADSSPPASASVPVFPAAADTIATATVPAAVVTRPAAAVSTSPPTTGTAVAPTVTSGAVIDDVGRESAEVEAAPQKNQEEKPDVELIRATVVRSWQNKDYRFVVQLDNGEVWQQTDGYRVNRPKAGESVEISKRRLGGYWIKIDKKGKLIGVRQTK